MKNPIQITREVCPYLWDEIDKAKVKDNEMALLKIDELNNKYLFNTFVLSIEQNKRYEFVRYSSYMNWFEQDAEEEEE